MSKVRILPDILSNKIAAGEVVERPASVVKELVENALDAKSRSIAIDVEKGGRRLIRVADDGCGMAADDAMLAIERYATSKIYTDEDLFNISTLGFRGEALPSIASVSRFSLTSRTEDQDVGCTVEMEGGKVTKVSETGAPKGTLISVSHLFFNTPARRKFLKGEGTEMGHIADTVSAIALAWPTVRFRLTHNGKPVRSWPATEDLRQRVEEVLGRDVRGHLAEVSLTRGELTVSGFVSSPEVTRSTTQKIFLYVNGRPVKDRVILNSLLSGYRPRLMKGRFPMGMLSITLPCDWVDVNVHPAKNEVRFRDASSVGLAVEDGVKEALAQAETASRHFGAARPAASFAPAASAPAPHRDDLDARVAEPTALFADEPAFTAPSSPLPPQAWQEADAQELYAPVMPLAPVEDACDALEDEPASPEDAPPVSAEAPPGQFSRLRIIGQYADTYILCDAGDGLILIDQHAAHERVVFEQLKGQGSVLSQRLLVPETVELGFREADAVSGILEELGRFGLEVEPFGGTTFVVKSVPAMLAADGMARLVSEIAEKMVRMGQRDTLERCLDECLILMACHGAIRAGQALSTKEVHRLLTELDACKDPSFCPHGRPTWIRWSTGSLERAFKR
ncbi:DNA mismatch repair endonuclease MutL [Desulfoluna spongiiphila]|uniref:DNA mismatch repair protein MutL n=1 Tax=Desulfoluna spongiiphila TaxID=419481 RepID=A0A1G5JL08_9BACT|nr:DNA mismatch repair endonuclease MutL [Desulfoluna spongiiphila]SCY88854.1 DNA mismatch repair protein MutL [Desulfoluna spongiiphila]